MIELDQLWLYMNYSNYALSDYNPNHTLIASSSLFESIDHSPSLYCHF